MQHHLKTVSRRLEILLPPHGRPLVTQSPEWTGLATAIGSAHRHISRRLGHVHARLLSRQSPERVSGRSRTLTEDHDDLSTASGAGLGDGGGGGGHEAPSRGGVVTVGGPRRDNAEQGASETGRDPLSSPSTPQSHEFPEKRDRGVSTGGELLQGAGEGEGEGVGVPDTPQPTATETEAETEDGRAMERDTVTAAQDKVVEAEMVDSTQPETDTVTVIHQDKPDAEMPDSTQHSETTDTVTAVHHDKLVDVEMHDSTQQAETTTDTVTSVHNQLEAVDSTQPEKDPVTSVLDKLEAEMLDVSGKLFNVETQMDFFVISDVFSLLVRERGSREVSVWSSGVSPFYQPHNFVHRTMTHCLRCPPSVQSVLQQVEKDMAVRGVERNGGRERRRHKERER